MSTSHKSNAYLLGFLAGSRLKMAPKTPDEEGYPANPYDEQEKANAGWDKGFMDAILERGPLATLSMIELERLPPDHTNLPSD